MPIVCGHCQQSAFDYAGVVTNPTDFYWDLVAGGAGALTDPVDLGPELTSLWTFGAPAGTDGLYSETGSISLSIDVVGGASQTLSFVLDTATGPQSNGLFATWGSFNNITLTPFIGADAQDKLIVDIIGSGFAPDDGTSTFTDADGIDVSLATNDFDASEDAAQAQGIWGIGFDLPGTDGNSEYTSYTLSFDYDFSTYDTQTPVSEPAAAGLALAAFAALWLARRRTARA
ncbi:MAG: hypothetical protein AAFR11_07220 [Pseudomonadota bacterium]